MTFPPTYVEGFHDKDSVLQMEYKDLGNTGLKVSKLSLGGGPFGGVYGEILEEEAIETIREAIRRGINYIDTAPAYGQGVSERVIGKALAGVPRQAYYISTKVSRYGKQWSDMFDRSENRIFSEFENSLQLLGLDYVDIVYVHDVEFGPLHLILEEALPAAVKLVEQKKAYHLGISAYPVSVMRDIIANSLFPIEVILSYARDLMFDNTLQEFIPFFKSRGIGVVNASLTGMGLFTKEGPPSWHPADAELKELSKKAAKYVEEKGVDISEISVSYSFNQPNADTYLLGMKDRKMLQKNLLLLKQFPEKYKQLSLELKQLYFSSKQNLHWEGNEISQYNKYLESICKQD